ncbi:MAG: thioredoxin domain-containing protein [Pseudomonadota bacterium]
MRRWALIVAFFSALLGVVLSILSTLQHFRIMSEGLERASFCAISDTINCDIVNASSYSTFLGVPIAWWGLCYYAVLGFLALFAFFSKKERRANISVAWFMSCGSILYSIFLAYVALVILEVVCIECMGMYVANIILFIFLFIALNIPIGGLVRFIRDYVRAVFGKASNLGFKPRIIGHAIGIGAVFLVGWGIIATVSAKETKAYDNVSPDEKLSAFYMRSLHDIEANPEWAVWGNPDAKVTIIEFSEYQCPFCRIAALNVKPYLQEFKDDVRYYFVNFPLDNACNDEMKQPMHPLACYAAKAGICAQERGDFWCFHDDLFRNQKSLSKKKILDLVKKHAWDVKEFEACIESPKALARVKREIEAARSIYVTSTPTILLNGRKLRYWRDPKFLQRVVKEEIRG